MQESYFGSNLMMMMIITDLKHQYYSHTQSRFHCLHMRAPPSHLVHLSPLCTEVLTDNTA